ncbi:exopolyphosphatase [Pleionea mediterranea]|uniref:Exopolyphosphatase n=1 Tax=Pleionea mediterranea TaxID=523701 RepID=A0A316FEG7_9GAMM|nr:exopolyphosphatase [Pleionea mediterranea]PWK46819.1 exopolyphosphatase/guanosine-5'-triphosphate,3'-diphosphate pyrophosphatase [Pleionea mediterranea]
MAEQPEKNIDEQVAPTIAAIDLGSNSFHLTLARLQHNNLQIIGRLKEKIRLAEGLDEQHMLSEQAQQRALDCLKQFRHRLHGLPQQQVRAVGTYTLRKAKNARQFLQLAQQALGYPIEVISGTEEARLIYEGVAHFQLSKHKQLVIDIGGGSTEFAIGEAFEPVLLDSLQMGCVSYSQKYFSDKHLNDENFERAITASQLELLSIQDLYLREGWSLTIGTSGTIESIVEICHGIGFKSNTITLDCLLTLKQQLLAMKHFDAIVLDGLAENRREILPAGLAILIAIFQTLKISSIETSPAALREGMLYELTGIEKIFDIKERAIKGLLNKHHVDMDQARRVNQTALVLWQKVARHWQLDDDQSRLILSWAARCHELGLNINFSKQQKHGEYILKNTDINGFSLQQQQQLALLVRSFRRKFPLHRFDTIDNKQDKQRLIRLARLLRLAVLFNHRRRDFDSPDADISIDDQDTLVLTFSKGYLEQHKLLAADLQQEQYFLNKAGLNLVINSE